MKFDHISGSQVDITKLEVLHRLDSRHCSRCGSTEFFEVRVSPAVKLMKPPLGNANDFGPSPRWADYLAICEGCKRLVELQ